MIKSTPNTASNNNRSNINLANVNNNSSSNESADLVNNNNADKIGGELQNHTHTSKLIGLSSFRRLFGRFIFLHSPCVLFSLFTFLQLRNMKMAKSGTRSQPKSPSKHTKHIIYHIEINLARLSVVCRAHIRQAYFVRS